MAEKAPLVSVVLPVYNRAGVVGRALESVLGQGFSDFELIVVDDGSEDDSLAVVESYDDKRVRVVALSENRGACAARNKGIELARGQYIAFQDSDDYWEPEKLEKQIKLFKEQPKGIGVLYCAFWRVYGENREYIPEEFIKEKEGDLSKSLLLRNFITTQAAVVSRECFEQVGGFDEALSRFQDWELWLRIAEKYRFAYLDQALVEVSYTDESISSEQGRLLEAMRYIHQKHYRLYEQAGSYYLAGMDFTYGHNLCLAGQMAEGRRHLARAVKRDKYNFKYLAAYLCSFFGRQFYRALYRRVVK